MVTQSNPKERQRLGFSFHRKFTLVRPAVTQVLEHAEEINSETGMSLDKVLQERTALGSIYREAMPRYARGAGLLDFNNRLTTFGRYALTNDRMLEQRSTQWLMHYHLSAPHGPGPGFWHALVVRHFRAGHEFTTAEINQDITTYVEQTEQRILSEKTLGPAKTAFVGTYAKPDGLGKLGILTELGNRDRYYVAEPPVPPVWAVACALFDYWAARFEGQLTVSLDTLAAPDGFVGLFMMGRQDLNEVLRALQGEHYVEVYRSVPPEQVVLLQQDIEPLLKKMYGVS